MMLLASLTTLAMAKELDITKAKGTDQSVISSLTPPTANMDVDQDVVLKVVFDVELDPKHVQKNNVKLKKITESQESMIDGAVAYDASENAVTFKPNTLLTYGYYEVEFKSLKATKANKSEQIKEIKYRFYVPEVINGHKLPPKPDETLNNSTLLGIDVNDNGVRDDVERWIYITYKDKHPIYVDIAMQAGRAWQKVLVDPSKAKEIYPIVDAASSCEAYFAVCVKDSEKSKYNIGRISSSDIFIHVVFNIKKRWDAYIQYDSLLSGDTYVIPWCSEKKQLCDFDTSKYEE